MGGPSPFGVSWIIIAGFLLTSGHFAATMALAMHLHGVRQGYRILRPSVRRLARFLTLETCIVIGATLIAASAVGLAGIAYRWSSHGFEALPSVLPLVVAAVSGALGLQTTLGGFVMAIIGGHSAEFVQTVRLRAIVLRGPSGIERAKGGMNAPVPVAAVGLGWVCRHRHLPVMGRSADYQVVGVIDRADGRARDLAERNHYRFHEQNGFAVRRPVAR